MNLIPIQDFFTAFLDPSHPHCFVLYIYIYINTYIWTLRLIDQIGPLGQFGEGGKNWRFKSFSKESGESLEETKPFCALFILKKQATLHCFKCITY